ncbi:MAG: sugar-binding domain-containing protein, partial [Candidatus Acidiferrales bacterium]
MAQISSSRVAVCLALLVLALFPSQVSANSSEQNHSRVFLHAGWALESSCLVKAPGERISSAGFHTDGWHAATVPSTVVAALVADKTYPDPNFGMNLRSIPGTSYPIGANFSLLPMPPDSPFRCSWWYRTEFRLPENFANRHIWLHFNGINYRANVWINGVMIASAKSVAGAYRTYEFNISPLVRRDRENVLAVETFAPTEKDLAITFADWNPAPPDKFMGLWGDVYLQASGAVSIRDPQVVTHFPNPSLARADLTVMAMLRNATSQQVTGSLEGNIGELKFRQLATLKPEETRTVQFTPEKFPDLHVQNPTLWWPYLLGPQNLHELSLHFVVGAEVSDSQTIRFGIREITSELNQKGYRLFRVNGKRILIRGGGWAPDMLLRQSRERLEAQFQYIRDLNLNTIRLEGKLESDDFYDLADEYGVLIMAGWSCCDRWEQSSEWRPGDLTIATKSLHSQVLRMRGHPSMLAWLNGSDNPPPAKVEKAYLSILKELNWPNPILSSAQNKPTTVTGRTGVKMTGPYDYVPPAYWLKDPGQYGGAFGFNTETSSGAAIPLVSSLRKMIPPDHLWPIDDFWNYHAASHEFKDLHRFTKALDKSYGPASSLEDYVTKSQAMAYDAERAMFEAYARNKYTSTGVIQWMLNNAWPSLFWHLYDYFLQPAGGYFGAKKACEPVHVQYSYDDRSVTVVNSLYEKFSGLDVAAELFDFNLKKRYSERAQIDLDADTVKRVLTIPPTESDASSPVYFLRLTLEDPAHRAVSSNFYWLASKPANIEYSKTIYFGNPAPPVNTAVESSIYTPASPYDDFTALKMLPRVSLHVAATIERGEHGPRVRVSLRNIADHLAFQIRLGIRKKNEEMEILPVLWDDNYVEL